MRRRSVAHLPKPIATTLNRTFEYVLNIQLATDLPKIDRFIFVGERSMSADTNEPSMRGKSVVRLSVTPVSEVLLLGITAEIGERRQGAQGRPVAGPLKSICQTSFGAGCSKRMYCAGGEGGGTRS